MAQIVAASEKILGMVRDVASNRSKAGGWLAITRLAFSAI